MKALSESFRIAELPQSIGSGSRDSTTCICGDEQLVHIAVSGSSIMSYSVRPTPRMSWSYSIPPSTRVTALSKDTKGNYMYYSTVERKKFHLHRVSCGESEDENKSIPSSSEICDIYVSPDGEYTYTVSKNSIVRCHSGDLNEEVWSSGAKASRTVVYSHLIRPKEHEDGPMHGTMLTVSSRDVGRKAVLEVRLIGLDGKDSIELLNKEIEEHGTERHHFSYGDGKLFVFRRDQEEAAIDVFSVPDLNLFSSTGLLIDDKVSLLAIGKNRVVVSGNDKLYVVDTKYRAVVDEKQMEQPITLRHYNNDVAFGLAQGAKGEWLVGSTVISGKGTLLEAIGRGTSGVSQWSMSFSDVLLRKNYSAKEYTTALRDSLVSSKLSATKLVEDLGDLRQKGDVAGFETRLLQYMKNEVKSDEDVIYEENDTEVDKEVISQVVSLIFSKKEKLELDSSFVPEGAMVYLLTHPLFPTPELDGLLDALYSHPRLFRQAVVTAPTLSGNDLVGALSYPDDEIFRDIVTRIVEEFGRETISGGIKTHYGRGRNTEEILRCVKRLMKLDIGWTIISCFVDAAGLFAWGDEIVSELSKGINGQVVSLEETSETMILLDEVLRKFTPASSSNDVSKLSKRELKKLSKKKKSNTESRLELGTRDVPDVGATFEARKKEAIRQANDFSKRLPVYTVEKLII